MLHFLFIVAEKVKEKVKHFYFGDFIDLFGLNSLQLTKKKTFLFIYNDQMRNGFLKSDVVLFFSFSAGNLCTVTGILCSWIS